ncbi:hypothetical protein QT231_18235 [Halomonas sp. SpR1]|uniref:hypothetical protein n=1 Tax=Halomonas sp. SpR1 TaxID=3050462 RepID=UPI0027E4FABA|nr:hypothetical protein [Halomonas sp. SpR1]MDQ7734652.1 hypothetical protein [Halomonas sp. SpR1]
MTHNRLDCPAMLGIVNRLVDLISTYFLVLIKANKNKLKSVPLRVGGAPNFSWLLGS